MRSRGNPPTPPRVRASVDHQDRIWNIVEQTAVGMLTTRFADGLRARPLEARPDRNGGVIYFIVDVRGLEDDEIEAAPDVCFTVASAHNKAYLSITARATVLRDPLLAAKFWKKTDDVWWPGGPDDRHVRVLRLAPLRAELRDGPASSEVANCEFAKARATGAEPNLGDNRKVSIDMS